MTSRARYDMPCAVVSEHLAGVAQLFHEFFKGLAAGGRLVFSAFHPDMAGFQHP
jgi:hypothetical protein